MTCGFTGQHRGVDRGVEDFADVVLAAGHQLAHQGDRLSRIGPPPRGDLAAGARQAHRRGLVCCWQRQAVLNW
ncbi:hypothetical protein [Streptomyces youssoufiensis]